MIGGLPADLVGSLTGLTEGRFPVAAKATLRRRGHQAQTSRPARAPTPPSRRRVRPPAQRHRDLRRRRLAGRRGQRRPGRRAIGTASASAASSRSRTSTATRTRTGTWPRSSPALPGAEAAEGRPGRDQAPARARQAKDAKPTRRRVRHGPARATDRRPTREGRQPRRAADDATPPPPAAAAARGQGAPVRQPDARRTPRTPAAPSRSSCAPAASTAPLQRYLTRVFGLDRDQIVTQAAQGGRAASPPARCSAASASLRGQAAPHVLLRDPPGRPRRPAHRPEADPRRLEAARVDRDLPRQGQEPVRRRRRRRRRRSARSC